MNPATPVAVGALTARWRRSAGTARGALLRVLLRVSAVTGAAVAVAAAHDAHDPGVLCMLRRLTGVPCPLCGSTTVFIEAGHGHWAAALGANPVTAVVTVAVLLAPLGPGRWWLGLTYRRRNVLIGSVLTLAWAWELGRFGFLPV